MKPEIKSFLSGVAVTAGPTIVFIVLKLTGIVSWSWWAITSPLLTYAVIFVITMIITICVGIRHNRNN